MKCFALPAMLGCLAGLTFAQQPPSAATHWIASWGTSMMAPEPQNNQPGIDPAKLIDSTVRQIVHLSAGGPELRLQLANTFGRHALVFDAVHVARTSASSTGAIDAPSDRPVTFHGSTTVAVPPGGVYLSDPVALPVDPLSDLAVSFHLQNAPDVQSLHQGSHQTTFLLHGSHSADPNLPGAEKIEHWFNLGEVDVASAWGATVVCFGDSITDGHGSTTDHNDRWPDVLAARLQAGPVNNRWGVVNEGIGGNHLLTDGLGENAIGRLDRDLLSVTAVRTAVLLEGINDIGALSRAPQSTAAEHAALVATLETAIAELAEQAHAHGIRLIGATITPFAGSDYYHSTATSEADRAAVNNWLRQPGHVDGVIDLDLVVRDPAHPDRMLPAFDSGDHLHPGPAGYKAIGEAVAAQLSK